MKKSLAKNPLRTPSHNALKKVSKRNNKRSNFRVTKNNNSSVHERIAKAYAISNFKKLMLRKNPKKRNLKHNKFRFKSNDKHLLNQTNKKMAKKNKSKKKIMKKNTNKKHTTKKHTTKKHTTKKHTNKNLNKSQNKKLSHKMKKSVVRQQF